MSILLKALKQAEADRQAAHARLQDDSPRLRTNIPAAATDKNEIARPSAEGLAAGPARNAPPLPAYGGLWITLALAVVSAAGFGYWMRGMSSINPSPATVSATPATNIQASVTRPDLPVATGPIPPALRAQEAGPLQLRLDRQFDKLGARTR